MEVISRFLRSACCDVPIRYVRCIITEQQWIYCTNSKCETYILGLLTDCLVDSGEAAKI